MVKGGANVDFTDSAGGKENEKTPVSARGPKPSTAAKTTPARPATGIKRPTTAITNSA